MSHKPIKIEHLSLMFPHKICFEDFSTEILDGSRIAIMGRNGNGKSSLLRMLMDIIQSTGSSVAFVPQIIDDVENLSGGERFNAALTVALSQHPDVLLLDEPTNHLDASNRKSLSRMLNAFHGTLIIVSHDVTLLRNLVDTLWHIDSGRIHIFSGQYDDYMHEMSIQRRAIEQELEQLGKEKKQIHQSLMKEQQRASKSRSKGEKSIAQKKWPTVVSKAKALNASETTGRKKSAITHQREDLNERLSELFVAEIILPTFSLTAADIGTKMLVSISDGTVGYPNNPNILTDLHFSVGAQARIALLGDNGSGKSTLVKAILQDPDVVTSGQWTLPKPQDIGYLDQHYSTLPASKTVLDCIRELRTDWTPIEARRHLNDFLFRKNEEVNALVSTLSGGERARLCLAQMAAKTPRLLILDEMTNNIDLETRDHVIEVLCEYPGALIVISHDDDFLKKLGITDWYDCQDRKVFPIS